MEDLIGVLIELAVQLAFDCLLDASIRSRSPAIKLIGSTLIACLAGIIFGVASLHFYRSHFIHTQWLRFSVLIFLPILNGLIMTSLGRMLSKGEKPRSGYENFIPAFAFTLVYGVLRYFGGV